MTSAGQVLASMIELSHARPTRRHALSGRSERLYPAMRLVPSGG
jgi:hypothetical protein